MIKSLEVSEDDRGIFLPCHEHTLDTDLFTECLFNITKGKVNISDMVGTAAQLRLNGEIQLSKELYRFWIKHNHNDQAVQNAYYNYGVYLFRDHSLPSLHDALAAKSALQEAIRIKSNFFSAYNVLGEVHEYLGKIDDATRCWNIVKMSFEQANLVDRAEYKQAFGHLNRIHDHSRKITLKDVCTALHPTSPYTGFNIKKLPLDLIGFGEPDPIFSEIISKLRPKEIIEVGTWKGSSIICMADIAKKMGIQSTMLCVDTWLGGKEHWEVPKYKASLNLKHGFPTLYQQFLANVIHSGHQNTITPFPVSSVNAALYLKAKNVKVDMVYIDAGHEYDDVINDIYRYWELLRPGGILLGDDLNPCWPGVVRAVSEFSKKIGQSVQGTLKAKWWLFK